MLHAADYANMQIGQMTRKVESAKILDQSIAKAIEHVSFNKHFQCVLKFIFL